MASERRLQLIPTCKYLSEMVSPVAHYQFRHPLETYDQCLNAMSTDDLEFSRPPQPETGARAQNGWSCLSAVRLTDDQRTALPNSSIHLRRIEQLFDCESPARKPGFP
jgi:hypothetical protein